MKQRTVLFALFTLLAVVAFSQPDSLRAPSTEAIHSLATETTVRIPSMEAVCEQNDWLAGANPVALSMNRFRSLSMAEITYGHGAGALGNPLLPASTDRCAISSESYQRLGNVSLYGKLGYALTRRHRPNWDGMTVGSHWSAVPLCDSISGNQRAERYELSGAFALPLGRHWLIGTRFDYHVEQTTKDTDPRNRNQWMEWTLAPGIGYECPRLRLGLSLLYARRTEGVDYQHVGNHVTYPVFVAYPLGFFGTLSGSEPINWHYASDEAGGALQMSIVRPQRMRLFQQLGGSLVRQSVEGNRVENRQQSETEAWQLTYTARVTCLLPHARHEWAARADYHQSCSYAPLQRQQAGAPWQTYGRVLRSTRHEGLYRLTYGYYLLRDAWQPRFSLLSGITLRQTESALLFYPAEYTQPLHRLTADVTLNRNFPLPSAQLDLSVGGQYGTGGGSIQNEKQGDGQTQPEIRLWQNTELQQQVYRYEVASRWQLNASLTYTRELAHSPLRWFVRLAGQYERGTEQLAQPHGSEITAQVGILF